MAEDKQKPDEPDGDAEKRRDLLDEELFKALHGGYGRRTFGFSDSLKAIKASMDDFHRRQEEMFKDSTIGKLMRESRAFSDRIDKFDRGWSKRLGLDKIGKPLFPKPPWADLPKPKIPENPWMKIFHESEGLRRAADSLNLGEFAAKRRPMSESLLGIADDLRRIRETTIQYTVPFHVRQPKPKDERPPVATTTSVGMTSLPPPPEHVKRLEAAEESARTAGTLLSVEPKKPQTPESADCDLAVVQDFVKKFGNITSAQRMTILTTDRGNVITHSMAYTGDGAVALAANVIPKDEIIDVKVGGEEPVLNEHAKRLLAKPVDWERRILVFKGKSRNKVIMPPKSDKAWDYMKRLLTTDDPEGWVELVDKDDVNWTADFDRRDENGRVDAKNPLTNLRCRIEPSRKRGRPKQDEYGESKKENLKIRLASFNKKLFESLVRSQKNAKKGRK